MKTGVTMVELLVAISILGILSTVAIVRLHSVSVTGRSPAEEAVSAARSQSLATGRPVTITVPSSAGGPLLVSAYPDGMVVVDGWPELDFFTGRVNETR